MSEAADYMARYNDQRRFEGNRQQVLQQHGHACSHCGGPAEVLHHIRPARGMLFPDNSPRNLRPLCRACHARLHTVERMVHLPPDARRLATDHARSFITPDIARRRALTRERERRQRNGQPDVLRRTCQYCGEAFERPNLARYRRVHHCSLRCARLSSWRIRKGA